MSLLSVIKTKWLYGLIGAGYFAILSLLFFPSVQKAFLARFHLRSAHFSQWAAMQFVPSVYNFENELWFWQETEEILPSQNIGHLYYNHFPLRFVSFRLNRGEFSINDPYYVLLKSIYRGRNIETLYRIYSDHNRLILEFIQ